ncbi:MAG: ABC transporter permease, partial [Acidimicrobiales bacterium]
MTATSESATGSRPRRGILQLGIDRAVLELKQFFRTRESVVFTFSLPIMLLLLFGAVFSGNVEGTDVPFRQVFIAGIIASAILSSGFQALAIGIAVERHDGTLKRLAGTPMPKAAYFIGKALLALVVGLCETVIMLALGVAFYGLTLPSDVVRWLTFTWVFVLGIIAATLMGIAYSRIPKDGRSAPAVVTPPFLFLQFISGVFFPFNQLGGGLQLIASLFPLRWLASGLRYVFLPDSFKQVEPGHTWNLALGAAVLLA